MNQKLDQPRLLATYIKMAQIVPTTDQKTSLHTHAPIKAMTENHLSSNLKRFTRKCFSATPHKSGHNFLLS